MAIPELVITVNTKVYETHNRYKSYIRSFSRYLFGHTVWCDMFCCQSLTINLSGNMNRLVQVHWWQSLS